MEQEHIVNANVDNFTMRLGKDGGPDSAEGLDMTKWFEMIAFDVLGEMAFGESYVLHVPRERQQLTLS